MARADEPGVNDVVCDQLSLGESPGQIAEQLHHQGDPRLQRVSDCPNGLGHRTHSGATAGSQVFVNSRAPSTRSLA
jgi:hypothetical protein